MTVYQVVQQFQDDLSRREVIVEWNTFSQAVQDLAYYQGRYPDAWLCVQGVSESESVN